MLILFIKGTNDYDATTFENYYSGQSMKKIISTHRKGEPLLAIDDDGEEVDIEYSIIDVPDTLMSRELRQFIKNDVMDYDAGKTCNFYTETESI